MKLSVIVPCLNAEATLSIQLDALVREEWSEPWEVIVADNGSRDNSLAIAHHYRELLPDLRVVDASDRKGPAHARNVGARAAMSEALAFCDADDEVAPGWVAVMGEALSKYDVVYGQFHFDKFNEPQQAAESARAWEGGLYRGRFLPGGGTGDLGVRRSVHEAIGGFDEDLLHSEDADYYWRLQLEGYELHYAPDAIVQVRHARVDPTTAYLYRRARARAASNYWLYKRYRSLGMSPPPSLMRSFVPWLHHLTRIPILAMNREKREAWLQQFAERSGDLTGQIQGRLTNPCKPYRPRKNNSQSATVSR